MTPDPKGEKKGAEPHKLSDLPVDWKQVALSFGEQLGSVGPDGYYSFTPKQWYEWAIKALALEKERSEPLPKNQVRKL